MLLKICIIQKIVSSKSYWALNFLQKSQWHTCLFLPGVELWVSEDLYCNEIEKQIHFWTEHGQNYRLYKTIVRIKVVQNWISYKKVNGCTCLSPPGVELPGLKDGYVSDIILYRSGKIYSLSGWTLPKLSIILENAPNKSCWAIHFVQKSQWTHVPISLRSGARELEW